MTWNLKHIWMPSMSLRHWNRHNYFLRWQTKDDLRKEDGARKNCQMLQSKKVIKLCNLLKKTKLIVHLPTLYSAYKEATKCNNHNNFLQGWLASDLAFSSWNWSLEFKCQKICINWWIWVIELYFAVWLMLMINWI